MTADSADYYDTLVRGISSTDVETWERQISDAEKNRLTDRRVMDIVGGRLSNDQDHIDTAEGETARGPVAKWLSLAIVIEQKQ